MNLFRAIRDRVDGQMGFALALIGDETGTARFVLSKSNAAVLLLTAAIEWMTQRHYIDAFRDDAGLDAFTKDIFQAHWLEESQHAKLDHLETLRAFASLDMDERDRAIDDLIELVAAVDGLLQQQVEHDIANLSRLVGRSFDAAQTREIHAAVLAAKRWTFIESGVTHPRFQELFVEVTTESQRSRVAEALGSLLAQQPLRA